MTSLNLSASCFFFGLHVLYFCACLLLPCGRTVQFLGLGLRWRVGRHGWSSEPSVQIYLHQQPEEVEQLLDERVFVHRTSSLQNPQQEVHQHVLHQIHLTLQPDSPTISARDLMTSHFQTEVISSIQTHRLHKQRPKQMI